MKKDQIHQSHLNAFITCAWRYYLRYMLGLIRPPGWVLALGHGVDHSVNKNLMHKIETKGELLTLDEVQQFARDAVVHKFDEEGLLLVCEEKEMGEGLVKAKTIDTAVSLATLHHKTLAPIIEPQDVQWEWVLLMEDKPYDLSGTADVVEKGLIRDTKTTGKKPAANAADTSLQLTAYAMAHWAIKGDIPEVGLDYLIRTKNPDINTQRSTRTVQQFDKLTRLFEMMIAHIEHGDFFPTGLGTWACQERYCGFYPCEHV